MAKQKSASQNFFDIITQAVNELSEHGYDSSERVAYWSELIRNAAEKIARPGPMMEKLLKDTLNKVYHQLVEKEGVLKTSFVDRFTLERIKPELRAELDRRIMASASLIKLNREEAIDTTVRRFQGWATSIPKGGSAEPEKVKTKKDVRKAMANLQFQERRVLVDQGHKLASAINATVAQGNGAIAARWHSNWRQAGYQFREDHKERDNKIYLLKDSWARFQGLIKPSSVGYLEDITQPAEEPFCRCKAEYLFHLRQLPKDMLTKKGADKLAEVRVKN